MPEIEFFEDKSAMMGKRRKGRDETIEDVFKTMERFSDWLVTARDRNPWQECDAVTTAMLYGMLAHLRAEIDNLIELGGEEARSTHEFFTRRKNETM